MREAPTPEELRSENARLRARVEDLERERNAQARLASGLRAAEERLAVALETAGLGLFEWEVARGSFWLHLPWVRSLGYRPDDLAPRFEAWRALVHPDDRARVTALLDGVRGAADAPGAVEIVHRLRDAGGGWRTVRMHGRVTARDPDGVPERLSGTLQLLGPGGSAQGPAPAEVLERLPVAVAVFDDGGRLAVANRAFTDLLGADPDAQAAVRERARAVAGDQADGTATFAVRGRDGTARTVAIRAVESGGRCLCVVDDVTRRRRAEAERERLIEELQSTLADVRTLRGLIPICSHCKRIRDDEGYWSQIEDYLRETTEASFSHGLCPGCLGTLYPEFEAGARPAGPGGSPRA